MKVRRERAWTTAVEAGSWPAMASKTGRRGRVGAMVAKEEEEEKKDLDEGAGRSGRGCEAGRDGGRRDGRRRGDGEMAGRPWTMGERPA